MTLRCESGIKVEVNVEVCFGTKLQIDNRGGEHRGANNR